jgi:hypothetical protein
MWYCMVHDNFWLIHSDTWGDKIAYLCSSESVVAIIAINTRLYTVIDPLLTNPKCSRYDMLGITTTFNSLIMTIHTLTQYTCTDTRLLPCMLPPMQSWMLYLHPIQPIEVRDLLQYQYGYGYHGFNKDIRYGWYDFAWLSPIDSEYGNEKCTIATSISSIRPVGTFDLNKYNPSDILLLIFPLTKVLTPY